MVWNGNLLFLLSILIENGNFHRKWQFWSKMVTFESLWQFRSEMAISILNGNFGPKWQFWFKMAISIQNRSFWFLMAICGLWWQFWVLNSDIVSASVDFRSSKFSYVTFFRVQPYRGIFLTMKAVSVPNLSNYALYLRPMIFEFFKKIFFTPWDPISKIDGSKDKIFF